jgi:hypothetical protein
MRIRAGFENGGPQNITRIECNKHKDPYTTRLVSSLSDDFGQMKRGFFLPLILFGIFAYTAPGDFPLPTFEKRHGSLLLYSS